MRRRRRKGLTGSAGSGSKTTTTNSSTKSNDGLFCLKAPELPRQTRHSPRFSPTVTGDEAYFLHHTPSNFCTQRPLTEMTSLHEPLHKNPVDVCGQSAGACR